MARLRIERPNGICNAGSKTPTSRSRLIRESHRIAAYTAKWFLRYFLGDRAMREPPLHLTPQLNRLVVSREPVRIAPGNAAR
jgi:hypothetical protein